MAKFIFVFIIITVAKCQQISNILEYSLVEEDPGKLLGNVAVDSRISQVYNATVLRQLTFRFLSRDAPEQSKFQIISSGVLRSTGPINRDELCSHQTICDLQYDIAVEPRQYFHIIKVTIHIDDINDNAPNFEEDSVSLSIAENTVDGTTFALPSAYDADIGQYGIQSFKLEPQLPSFSLDANINPDGRLNLHLILANSVDRESNQFYVLRVVVSDGGFPVRTGVLNIDITVLDSNDNNPRFTNSTYQVEINENIAVDSFLVQVNAVDSDEGQNGELTYELARSSLNQYGHLFGLDPSSGTVFTKAELDYEQGSLYVLSIKATDGGLTPLSSYTRLNVVVRDVNDNYPEIRVNALHGSHAEVPEHTAINGFVARVIVSDRDSGDNGKVLCSMNSEYFAMEHLYGNEYQVLTRTTFDRETQDEYNAEIRCVDHGNATLITTQILQVFITDINDFTPTFNRDSYTLNIDEGNEIDAYIVTLAAEDNDLDSNADLRYSIQQVRPALPGNMEALALDTFQGLIYANVVFDYETTQQYEFLVSVRDNGSPVRSSSTTLTVNVVDINDEPPVFNQSFYIFGTYENQVPNTEVGTIQAYDRDASANFRDISYVLDARFTDTSTFSIDNRTGRITVKKVLDREARATYNLRAVAYNPGYTLSSVVNVTVHVADRNDNAPILSFPRYSNNTLDIMGNHKVGSTVTIIAATDHDIGVNAALKYTIVNGNEDGYFELDLLTGELLLFEAFSDDVMNRIIELVILVADGGQPSLSATESLHIFVNGSFTTGASKSEQASKSTSNIAIVIICVFVFVIICIALVLFTICVIKRNTFRQCRQTTPPKYDGPVGLGSGSAGDFADINASAKSPGVPHRAEKNGPISGAQISYISDDMSTSHEQTYYQRVPGNGTRLNGFRPAGTLGLDGKGNIPKPSFDSDLHIQNAHGITARDSGQESDNNSLTDSGKGSSEGDIISHSISPLGDNKVRSLVQNAGFMRDTSCSIYKASTRPPNVETVKKPFQTYLTETPHVLSCHPANDCGRDIPKKSVHFKDTPITHSSDYQNSYSSVVRKSDSSTQLQTSNLKAQSSQQSQPEQLCFKPPPFTQETDSRPYGRTVINLNDYLGHRRRSSDCDSNDGCSEGGTTTSGSYCMEDEDLAHDVLV